MEYKSSNRYELYVFGSDALKSLDLSRFDTSKVTNMSSMFSGCNKLTNLNLSSFDTSQVTDMSYMFRICEKLTSLNLSSFDTSQVTDMERMFENCIRLTSLDLGIFNTSQVTDMSYMFAFCSSLTNLDMRNATNYSSMFNYVANGINIIVKDTTAKTWIEARLSDASRMGTVTIASA